MIDKLDVCRIAQPAGLLFDRARRRVGAKRAEMTPRCVMSNTCERFLARALARITCAALARMMALLCFLFFLILPYSLFASPIY